MARIGIGIDCQNGFAAPDGGLFVPGADEAMDRYGAGIEKDPDYYDDFVLSYDWHPRTHMMSAGAARIATAVGDTVGGYTPMTQAQVEDGEYVGVHPADKPWLKTYVGNLAATGKKDLMVWPEHCVAGTWDAELYHAVQRGIDVWENHHQKRARRHFKGTCPDREQYGAWGDEVPDRAGIMRFETELVRWILSFEEKEWAGLVLSHCLMASFDQAMSLESPSRYGTHTIMTDCTTIVPGFEEPTAAWLAAWQEKGVQVAEMAPRLV